MFLSILSPCRPLRCDSILTLLFFSIDAIVFVTNDSKSALYAPFHIANGHKKYRSQRGMQKRRRKNEQKTHCGATAASFVAFQAKQFSKLKAMLSISFRLAGVSFGRIKTFCIFIVQSNQSEQYARLLSVFLSTVAIFILIASEQHHRLIWDHITKTNETYCTCVQYNWHYSPYNRMKKQH